jgi:hypothetical protein
MSLTCVSGHSEPSVYSGPSVSVLSSNITSSLLTAQLSLNNVTTWQDQGTLDISSSNAGIIWALGTSGPSDPSNPNSDFQQHAYDGTFTINMAAAQVTQAGASTSASSSSDPDSGSSLGGVFGKNSTEGEGSSEGNSTSTQTPSDGLAPEITGQSSEGQISLIGLTSRQKVRIPLSFLPLSRLWSSTCSCDCR